jgi:hypothetical protein
MNLNGLKEGHRPNPIKFFWKKIPLEGLFAAS